MSKDSKTGIILRDKVKSNAISHSVTDTEDVSACVPCKQKNNTLWRVYIHHNMMFTDAANTNKSYKIVGDALHQYAGFSSAHIQAIFTSMALLPSEMHLIYSGTQEIAFQIQNMLNTAGLQTSIEATLRKF